MNRDEIATIEKPLNPSHSQIFTSVVQGKIALHSSLDGLQFYDIQNAKLIKDFTKSVYGNNTLKHIRLGCGQGDFLKQPPFDISLDSRYVVSTLTYQKIALWDMRKVELIGVFGDGQKTISNVTITADNRYIFCSTFSYFDDDSTPCTIEMYDVESSLLVYSFEIDEPYAKVVLLRTTPDNLYLIAILAGGILLKWDIEVLELVERKGIACHEYDIFSPTISLDGSLVLYGLGRNTWYESIESIEINDINLGRRVENIKYQLSAVYRTFLTINISENNRYVDVYGNNIHIFCWDRVDKTFLYDSKINNFEREKYEDPILNSKIAPNGKYRVNIYKDEKRGLSIWDMEDNSELYRLLVAENNNSLIIDVSENEFIVDGENELVYEGRI